MNFELLIILNNFRTFFRFWWHLNLGLLGLPPGIPLDWVNSFVQYWYCFSVKPRIAESQIAEAYLAEKQGLPYIFEESITKGRKSLIFWPFEFGPFFIRPNDFRPFHLDPFSNTLIGWIAIVRISINRIIIDQMSGDRPTSPPAWRFSNSAFF